MNDMGLHMIITPDYIIVPRFILISTPDLMTPQVEF